MEKDFMLTTYDNTFNPFTDFQRWWKEDRLLGYDTCGLLASVANTTDQDSDEIEAEKIDDAMNWIVTQYPMYYKKVSKEDYAIA